MPEEIRYVVTLNESKYWTFAVANGKDRGGWLARDKDLAVCLRVAAEKIGGPVPEDKPLGFDALTIAGLETPHEIIIAVASLSREGEQIMLRKLAWALAETGEFENRRMLKEALTAASLV